MAINEYRIREFLGVDQSTQEGSIDPGASPDACNMDTTDGSLGIAKGYVKHILEPIPGTGTIRRLFAWQGLVTSRLIAVAGNQLYSYNLTSDNPKWEVIYTYPSSITGLRWDTIEAQIGGADYLIFACGENQLVKWNGSGSASTFGSSGNSSNISVNFLAMHYGRLFSAGDPSNPSRLYWSQAPGDGRSIENWKKDTASENTSGGYIEVGDTSGDPITGLCSLSNQLLIYKRRSIYRLLGDRPSNYRVYRVYAEVEQMQNSSRIIYGDIPYWMTGGGLYYFDGQTAIRSRYARRIREFLKGADFSNCRAAKYRDKLYFTAYEKDRDPTGAGSSRAFDNALVVYDVQRQTYMIRRGFTVSDICAFNDRLLLVNENRYIYRFEEGGDYDGAPINAYWNTPLTDLLQKPGVKTLQELYLRGTGESEGEGAVILLDARIGRSQHNYRYLMPENESDVLEIPLKNEGRTFALRFSNENGSRWRIIGGAQLVFDMRMRTM